ncbi:MAG: TIGR03067 domain-containing protein [Gemmataceae bacterium]|nr:TIGR03067 domain-containing protein [Gemmataceae bacterium]
MRFVTAVGLVAALGWGVTADDKKDDGKGKGGKLDPAALVGTWEFVSGIKNGEKADPDGLKASSFTVNKDGTAVLGGPAGEFKLKYKLDAADPAKIDFEITDGPVAVGEKAPGIIKLDKGMVTLAYAPMGGDRPTKFDGEKSYLFVLKKKEAGKKEDKKPADKSPEAKPDPARD